MNYFIIGMMKQKYIGNQNSYITHVSYACNRVTWAIFNLSNSHKTSTNHLFLCTLQIHALQHDLNQLKIALH